MAKLFLIVLSILLTLFLLIITVSYISNIIFNQKVNSEIKELYKNRGEDKKDLISKDNLKGLPQPVQRWLEVSNVIGKERINTALIKQTAVMRTTPDQAWMPTDAEYYYTLNEPGFIWKAKIKAAPLINIVGRDMYYQGKGHMLIKLLSVFTVGDARGKEIDQGTLLRFLGEAVWFPSAVLNDYIKWEEIDSKSAKATMNYKGVTASGVFTFNEKGEVVSFGAERYMESKGQYSLETWLIEVKEHKEFNGIIIPNKGEVIWKLKTGDFSWFKFEITDIDYNKTF